MATAATAPPLDGVVAAALAEHRDRCNALVARARRERPAFDVAVLEAQLRGPVAAAVEAAEAAAPGRGPAVLAALLGPVVELVGQRRLGGGSHDAWSAALADLGPVLATEPTRVVGSLANAVVHLTAAGLPAERWLARVTAAAAVDADPSTVLRAGQVAAWAVGLAHLRPGALDVAATLPAGVLAAALGDGGAVEDGPATVERLRADRWWTPGGAGPAVGTVVHHVGGFRGFGGPFLAPPLVAADGDRVLVLSGDDTWQLHADAFGATLTRADPPLPGDGPPAATGDHRTSSARVGDLAAATVTTSYRVLVMDPVDR